MRFPPSFIERLRSHFLLSEVIGRRIPIKKHGREFMALCPFHNEKTPSFTISDEKNFFHCFGCAAHGDAIEFVKRYERLTYPETIEHLAREAGIPLPEFSPEEKKKAEVESTLMGALEAAAQWFESQLATNANARAYVEKRGLTAETIRTFRIGWAPDERTGLHQHLLSKGFPQALQAEAGLIIVPDEGGAYDRFRGRVMFPIRNASGKIIAFGGRLLASNDSGKTLAKYLNSPETAVFHKGEMLYNLDLAKRPAREIQMAVVMEGYMDVVSTFQAGVHYAVATLGTAVTPEHLRLLWQLCKEPVICLDGDAAGKRAMLRAAEVVLPLLKPGFGLRFAVLPAGEDPDTYIQKNGKASFEKILANARRLSQVLWEALAAQHKLDLPEGRAALENDCRQIAGKIGDETVRAHYASYFKSQLWAKAAPNNKNKKPQGKEGRSEQIEHMIVRQHSATLDRLAGRMLLTLLQFPQLLHKSHVEETLSQLDIHNPALVIFRDALLDVAHHGDIDVRETFAAAVTARLQEGVLSGIKAEMHPAEREPSTLEEAQKLWHDTAWAYQITHMEYELEQLQETHGQSMDEEAYARFVELKQALHKAQSARTFAPPEADVA